MILANIGLHHYLIVSALLLGFGVLTVATRRNAVAVLMGVELILNAANLNFVAFAHFVEAKVGGQAFAVFIILLAAAEASVALAIVLAVFRGFRTIDTNATSTLKE
jgi:NADH-quinone oxidoreductase subunit K